MDLSFHGICHAWIVDRNETNELQQTFMKHSFFILFMLTGVYGAVAQDTVALAQRRNTIKLDLTSRFLYNNALIVSYERVTKPNQSFSITAGYQEFPRASSLGQNVAVKEDRKKNGFKFGG